MCRRGRLQWRLLHVRNRVRFSWGQWWCRRDSQDASQTLQTFFFALFFLYTPLTTQTLRMWRCESIGSDRFLAADYQISCNSPEYRFYAGWAGLSAGLYLAGIPYLFLVLVFRQRSRHVEPYLRILFKANEMEAMDTDLVVRQSCMRHAWNRTKTFIQRIAIWLSDALGGLTDRCLLESVRHVSLDTMFATGDARLAAVHAEREQLIQASHADCVARHVLPSRNQVNTVRA